MMNSTRTNLRWVLLAVGMLGMLFSGVIYAWSILKTPLSAEFEWSASDLAVNFTITMSCFCIGGMAGSVLSKRIGCRAAIIIAAILSGSGFALSSVLDGSSVAMLYLSYGIISGFGIGIAYNVIISSISAWFPDKKGICSGCLMMAFGASALILGSLISGFIESPNIGWRKAYLILGISISVVLLASALIIRLPSGQISIPQKSADRKAAEGIELSPGEMLKRVSFWLGFVCLVFMAALGNSIISFARDLSIFAGAGSTLATSLVGIISICNGAGRIITGMVFDAIGRRKTMLLANCVCILAAATVLVGVVTEILPVFIAGLCLTGLSYGSCPLITSTFTMDFYGAKHFPVNFSLMNFNLMGASLMATVSSLVLTQSNSFVRPLILLLALTIVSLFLNLCIRKP